jgi:glycosyltransferase involved in cell wall biosynthesis
MRLMMLHRNLGFGGAEMLVVAVGAGLKKRGHDVRVVTFYDNNPVGDQLRECEVPVECLGKRGRWDIARFGCSFLSAVRRFQPDILYTVLPDSNLVALTARLAKPNLKLVWGVSVAYLDLRPYDFVTRTSYWLEARLAGLADLVISNSNAGVKAAISRGFPSKTMHVVPNGVDMDHYRPDPLARDRLRAEWHVGRNENLVGMIGRLDPQKDIPTFLAAAEAVARSDKSLRFVIVGDGAEEYRAELKALCAKLGLADRTLWIPARPDIGAVYNALDLIVISASAEGTSYALVQAMACGTSAVVTRAGDNWLAVGSWGEVAPPRDPAALADAVKRQLARLGVDHDGVAAGCRQHIRDNFSIQALVAKTEALMLSLQPERNTLMPSLGNC